MKLVLRLVVCCCLFVFADRMNAGVVLNSPPVAVEDEGFTYQDFSTSGDLSENDYDPDGDELFYTLVSGTPNGTITINPDGTYFFVPNPYYFGVSSITYQVCDGNGGCAIGLLMMYVPFLNDPPQANDDLLMVEMDEGRFGDARANDYEPDLENMVYYKLVGPFNGTVTFNSNGTFFYVPNPGFTGTDFIVYQACDPCLVCDQATINITVTGPNEDPSASPSLNNQVPEDTQLTGNLSQFVTDPENDPITFSVQTQPSQGTVVISSNGDFVFTPAANFSGNVTFNYLACDVFGQCALGSFGINVLPVNDAPVAQNDIASGNEDAQVTGSVASNDLDSDSPGLIYSLTSTSINGIIQFNADGSFVYTPASNWFGQEVLTYQVCDQLALCATATLTIDIISENDAPVAIDDFATGLEDVPVSGTVANDTDVESSVLVYSAPVSQTNGSIVMLSDGSYTYYPNENWSGTEIIQYSVCDQQGACDQGVLTITITYVADQPVVQNEQLSTNEDTVLAGDVALNDNSNGEGQLSYSVIAAPAFGTITLNTNGTFNYTPASNWFGTVTVTYLGCNGANVCDSGVLTINVISVNDPVVANDGSSNISEDTALNANLNALASDVEDAVLTYSIVVQPQFGTVTLGSNGAFTFQPAPNYFGPDQFTYSACDAQGSCDQGVYIISVSSVNDSPVAEDGEAYTGEDNPFIWFLPEATDADGDDLTYSLITPPMHGTVVVEPDGTYSFTPDYNYHGVDVMTYMVCDESGACDAAVVVIYVFSINDDPVAVDDFNTINSNSLLSGTVAANDYDLDIEPLTYISLEGAEFGTFVLNQDGTYTYVSNLDWEGLETITYFVCDSCGACASATLTISVVLVNTPPMLSANDNETTNEDVLLLGDVAPLATDAEGGTLIFSILQSTSNGTLVLDTDGSYTYTPFQHYHGNDQFEFRVCDTGGLCADGVVSITVVPVNDIPVATADVFNIQEDQIFNGSVSTNDSDADNDVLTYSVIMPPIYGMFTLSTTGDLMYHPAANYSGNDQLIYSVCDAQNACVQTTVSLVVVPVNDPPVLTDSEIFTDEEVISTGILASNASDVDFDSFTFSVVTPPAHGQLTISSNGNYSFNPDYNFSGMDEFEYRVCDGGGACDTAIVSVTINFVNDLPVVNSESYSGNEDTVITGTVADNDYDLDIEGLVWLIIFGPQNGTATMNLEGDFVYTPNPNYFGQDILTYMACDSCGACSAGQLSLSILGVNDFPVASDDIFSLSQGQVLSGSLALNDTDVDDTALLYTLSTPFENGSFVLNSNGTFNFVPDENLIGLVELDYEVCDDSGDCATASVIITIDPVVENVPPVAADDFATMQQGSVLNGTVASNDTDADNDELIYSYDGDFTDGVFVMNQDGTYEFIPNETLYGAIEILYNVCDPSGDCDSGSLTITINQLNNPPVAVDDNETMISGEILSSSVASNDHDDENDPLTYTFTGEFTQGTFVMNSDGSYVFTPDQNLAGVVVLSYQVCDGLNQCSSAQLIIDIEEPVVINLPPTAQDVATSICEGSNWIFDLDDVIHDAEDVQEALTLQIVSGDYFSIDPNSHQITFDAQTLMPGTYTINYEVCDTGTPSLCDQSEVSIAVVALNQVFIDEVYVDFVSCFGANDGGIEIVSVAGLGNISYQWEQGSTLSSLSGLSSGDYLVQISSDAECSVPSSSLITVPGPSAPLNVTISSYSNIDEGYDGSIELAISGGTAPYSVQWSGPNGFVSSDVNLNELNNAGQYVATITDDNGCSTQLGLSLVGTEEINSLYSLKVMPNPTQGIFRINITGASNKEISYSMFDSQGRVVLSAKPTISSDMFSEEIDASELASGIYHLNFLIGDSFKTVKVIIQ